MTGSVAVKRLTHKLEPGTQPDARLTLDFAARSKSRLRARLDDGTEVAIVLPRGSRLSGGDLVGAPEGFVIEVVAARETVSRVTTADHLLLARACYHLGNRHVALQVLPGELRYLHDHVLDDMIRKLGLTVETMELAFEPESGAYGSHAHVHGHDHGHGH